MKLINVGAAVLNQVPLDWAGNKARIQGAIAAARPAKHSPEFQALLWCQQNKAEARFMDLPSPVFLGLMDRDQGAAVVEQNETQETKQQAPNGGAIAQNEPANLHQVVPTLRRRAEQVLAIARAHQVDRLVLGTWGCGVFRNDPRTVAGVFADLLKSPGALAGTFGEVAFAVFDRSENQATHRAFAEILG